MAQRNILIVAVDGLRASALGAYGNTVYGTPALDRFAADSFLFDSCLAPSADLEELYRVLWSSQNPLRPTIVDQPATLPKILSDDDWLTALITDERAIETFRGAADFEHRVDVNPVAENGAMGMRARETSQTAMARLFSAVCDAIEPAGIATGMPNKHSRGTRPRLIWVHAQGMYGSWDAPLELQQQLLDEGDPPPVESVTPPDSWLTKADGPDAAFRYSCAYAAQIMTLDACWDGLMEAVEAASTDDEWLVMLVGLRGFPLGEHRRIGGVDERTYGEQLHVPWLVRFPSGVGRLARSGALTSHVDLLPTILDWLEIRPHESIALDGSSVLPLVANPRAPWRDALIATGQSNRAVRTPEWCLRQDLEHEAESSPASELYVRPDDRWEANDVAKLCPDVVESLTHLANDLSRQFSEPR